MADSSLVQGSVSSLIEFDDQQIAKIGAALQAVADQKVYKQSQPELKRKLCDETFFTAANLNDRSSSPIKKEPFSMKKYKNQFNRNLDEHEDETVPSNSTCTKSDLFKHKNQSYPNLYENEDETIIKTESSNSSSTTNDIPLIKEEFQLQEFNIKSEPDDNTLAINNITVSKEQNQLQRYEIKGSETEDDTLLIKYEQQQQELEIKPPEADDNSSNTNEKQYCNMQHIKNEGCKPPKDCCIEKDDENVTLYLIETDSENEQGDSENEQGDSEIEQGDSENKQGDSENEQEDAQDYQQVSGFNYDSFICYICPECGVECGSYSKWKSHTEKKHKFNTSAWLNLSITTDGYHCRDCNKILPQGRDNRALKAHHITHLPYKQYLKCNICCTGITSKHNMYKHLRNMHGDLLRPHSNEKVSNPFMKYIKIFCPICLQSQIDDKTWWQHLTEKHDYSNVMKSRVEQINKFTYSCKLCKQIIFESSLKTHILLHESNKSFQCTLCEKFVPCPSTAHQHMRDQHFNNYKRPDECSYCQATFAGNTRIYTQNLY